MNELLLKIYFKFKNFYEKWMHDTQKEKEEYYARKAKKNTKGV